MYQENRLFLFQVVRSKARWETRGGQTRKSCEKQTYGDACADAGLVRQAPEGETKRAPHSNPPTPHSSCPQPEPTPSFHQTKVQDWCSDELCGLLLDMAYGILSVRLFAVCAGPFFSPPLQGDAEANNILSFCGPAIETSPETAPDLFLRDLKYWAERERMALLRGFGVPACREIPQMLPDA